MSSDRARASYDESRQYRSVVMQQGRVTLEADWNEAEQIASEEERKEARDFVGLVGTPDDGYRVIEPGTASSPPFNFTVSKGTMYVGGIRVYAADDIVYSQQPDWLDRILATEWADRKSRDTEGIFLILREQEVSATEDTALREVALGGPDTAQRTRLMQHIERIRVNGRDCAAAEESAAKRWANLGLAPARDTMRLLSRSTLQVSFAETKPATDPCDPPATGGYLGADNQLIRVQIYDVDEHGHFSFVWGFDDASFLYRVTALDSQNLQLKSTPVDQHHQPRSGQAVEVLRTAAAIGNDNYIASATGKVFTLNSAYNADQQTVTLPSALPAEYLSANVTPMLFVRVWEKKVRVLPGTPVQLGDTGVMVTLEAHGNRFHVGDFWLIGVRPITPQKVYPQRLHDAPQPPDGPRLWFCPLAVIEWTNAILHVLEDCRKHFDNLVGLTRRRLGGCCTIIVRPGDLQGRNTLQTILDTYVHQEKIRVCLMPGVYELPEPLRLGPQHSNLTLEACHDGAILRAAPGSENAFIDGLVVLTHANNVTIRGLRFDLPQVPFTAGGGKLTYLESKAAKKAAPVLERVFVSIGVRPVHCALLAIEECLFRFSLTSNQDVFGVGVFASSESWGFRLTGCRFVREEDFLRHMSRPFRVLIGYLLAPSLSRVGKLAAGRKSPATAVAKLAAGTESTTTRYIRAVLQDAKIEDNLFSGLSVASFVAAQMGMVTIERNTVRECYAGFVLGSLEYLLQSETLGDVRVDKAVLESAEALYAALSGRARDPLLALVFSTAARYPLPVAFEASYSTPLEKISSKTIERGKARMQAVIDRLLAIFDGREEAASRSSKKKKTKSPAAEPIAEYVRLADTMPPSESGLAGEPQLQMFTELSSELSLVEWEAIEKVRTAGISLSLTFTANQVDVRVSGMSTSYGLLMIDTDFATNSNVLLTGNIIRNRASARPSVGVLSAERCTVTGNIIVNEAESVDPYPISIALFPGGAGAATVAVTGNVFKGKARLPARPHLNPPAPAPMNTWHFLNSES